MKTRIDAALRALVLALPAAAALAACDDPNAKRMWARIEEQHAAADPPQLWSVAVEGQANNGRPVQVCTDTLMRQTFLRVTPTIGDRECLQTGEATATPGGSYFKCDLGGVGYGVSTAIKGDVKRDFTTVSNIHPLFGSGGDSTRRLHYRRLGACPAGWTVGTTTDQQGHRVSPG